LWRSGRSRGRFGVLARLRQITIEGCLPHRKSLLLGTTTPIIRARICHSTRSPASPTPGATSHGPTATKRHPSNAKDNHDHGRQFPGGGDPVSLQHILKARRLKTAPTLTSSIADDAHGSRTHRVCPGTPGHPPFPTIYGVCCGTHFFFRNGWEDKEFIASGSMGFGSIRKEVRRKWPPDEVGKRVTGLPEAAGQNALLFWRFSQAEPSCLSGEGQTQ